MPHTMNQEKLLGLDPDLDLDPVVDYWVGALASILSGRKSV